MGGVRTTSAVEDHPSLLFYFSLLFLFLLVLLLLLHPLLLVFIVTAIIVLKWYTENFVSVNNMYANLKDDSPESLVLSSSRVVFCVVFLFKKKNVVDRLTSQKIS